MTQNIEIYVRSSGDQTMLNFYIPAQLRDKLVAAIQQGSFSDSSVSIALEINPQHQWITDGEDRIKAIQRSAQAPHLRVPLTAINFQITD